MSTRAKKINAIRQPEASQLPSLLTVAYSETLANEFLNADDRGLYDGVQAPDYGCFTTRGWANKCVEGPDTIRPGQQFGVASPIHPEDPTNPARLDKGEPVASPWVRFRPWVFFARTGCELDFGDDTLDYAGLADATVNEETATAISEELWSGFYSQGHSLMRDAIDLTPHGPLSLAAGIGLLLRTIKRPGTLHVPIELEPFMLGAGLHEDRNGVPMTAGRWPIAYSLLNNRYAPVPSPWRPNVYDDDPAGPITAPPPLADDEAYIVGHIGRFEAAWRDIPQPVHSPGMEGTRRDPHTNRVEAMSEREAIFRYSTCRIYCVRVRVCLCPDCD